MSSALTRSRKSGTIERVISPVTRKFRREIAEITSFVVRVSRARSGNFAEENSRLGVSPNEEVSSRSSQMMVIVCNLCAKVSRKSEVTQGWEGEEAIPR